MQDYYEGYLMPDFEKSKAELAELLETEAVSFRDWGDALSVHFSDGCDDFYYTASAPESPAEFVGKFQMIDASRTRLLNALRHAAYKRSLFLDLDKSGSWTVGSRDGASWSVDVGAKLTKVIDEQGEIEAFRYMLKELYSWEAGAGCLGSIVQGGVMISQKKFIRGIFRAVAGCIGSIAGGLAKNLMSPVSAQSPDKQIISYINSHSKTPKHEYTWEEFEEREANRECIELFPDKTGEGKGNDTDDFQDLFNQFKKEGPHLLEPDELQKSKIDQASSSRIEAFLETLNEGISYEKILLPWFNAPDDVWMKSDLLIKKLENRAAEARKRDDFWDEIGSLEKLLILKCDKYRERTRQLMDEWWEGGGHDMQDYPGLLNAFPNHPATAEMLEPGDMDPETSMQARRGFEVDISREWEELKNFYKKDRLVKLDDILEIVNKLSAEMIKKLMTDEQINYIHRFCMEAAKEATVEDMQFSHEHILHLTWKMGWTDIAKTMRQRDDYTALLFGFSISASEMGSWTEKALCKVSETAGLEMPPQKSVPEIFDTYYFAKSILIWSLFMPDEFTQRLIATALEVLRKGKGCNDDYLACAIAWRRCRKSM